MSKTKKFTTTTGERLSYGFYAFGAILVYYMVASYLQLYMTDIGISAVTIGIIFIIAKTWDGLNDPMFGVIVDKVNFKKGKFLPWIKIASIAVPLTTIFMFIIPANLSVQVKVVWATLAYILWDLAYTMYDVPASAIVTAMTEDLNERNKLYSLAAFFVYLGGLIVAVTVPVLYPTIGWGTTSIIIGILAFISMIPIRFKAKERYNHMQEKEISLKEIFKVLGQNKFLLIFVGCSIVGSLTNFTITLQGYFAIYCLGSANYITPLALATAIPVLLISFIVPKLFEKVDKFKCYIVTRIVCVVLNIVIFIFGYRNLGLLIGLIVFKQLFESVWGIASIMFISDCIEYGQYKTGERIQGVAFSLKAFTNKILIALTGAMGMFALAAVGFVSGSGAVQTQGTINGIWTLYSLAPAASNIVAIILLIIFYKLRDRDVKIMIQCNNGEISKEAARIALSGRF